MKIVLATPLYPPDIGEAAAYSKEAARRLSEKHDVTVVAYGRLPENVPEVRVISVSKQRPVLVRLFEYTVALIREARDADVIYAQNGASVELPVVVASLFTRTPFILHIADAPAHGRSKKSAVLGFIQGLAHNRARTVFADMPLERPEILPFEPYPEGDVASYEASWREHLGTLERILRHE